MAEGNKSSSLVDYVENVLYKEFSSNRAELFEILWAECRDAFLKLRQTKMKKGEAGEGGKKEDEWRSKVYVGIVRQKVISAYALIVDQLLQDGKFPYTLSPNSWMAAQMADMNSDDVQVAKKAIDELKSLIDMQLKDCNADEQLRNCIYSIAIYGLAFAKKITKIKTTRYYAPPTGQAIPLPQVSGVNPLAPAGNVFELVTTTKIQPGIEHVNVWNMFWDVENPIGQGAGEIERQMVSPDWLRGLIGDEFFIEENILQVVRTKSADRKTTATAGGTTPTNINPALKNIPKRFNNIDYKECYVNVPVELVEEFEEEYGLTPELADGEVYQRTNPDECKKAMVLICIADGIPVRFTRITPDLRPYLKVVWQNDIGEIAPYGVAESCLDVEKLMNGAVRGMADNKMLSGNVMFGMKVDGIDNMAEIKRDGLKPGTIFHLNSQAKTVGDAVKQFSVNDQGDTYTPVIEFASRAADEESMIPKTSQGLALGNRETAYAISQMVEKSGKYIGSVIKNLDEFIEAIVLYMYDYNMMDETVDVQKGDYQIDACGFTFFQDRVVRGQKLKEFLSMIMQHEELMAGWKVDEIMTQIAKALDLDPDEIKKTNSDKQKEAAEAAQQPPDPMMEAELKLKDATTQKELASAAKMNEQAKIMEREMKVKEALAVKELNAPAETASPEDTAASAGKMAVDARKVELDAEKNDLKAKELDDKVHMQAMQHEHEKNLKASDNVMGVAQMANDQEMQSTEMENEDAQQEESEESGTD